MNCAKWLQPPTSTTKLTHSICFGTFFARRSNIKEGEVSTKSLSNKLKKVLREVKILALLDHPHIVRYYTAWLELDSSSSSDDVNNAQSKTEMSSITNRKINPIFDDSMSKLDPTQDTPNTNTNANTTGREDLGFDWEPNTVNQSVDEISMWR